MGLITYVNKYAFICNLGHCTHSEGIISSVISYRSLQRLRNVTFMKFFYRFSTMELWVYIIRVILSNKQCVDIMCIHTHIFLQFTIAATV